MVPSARCPPVHCNYPYATQVGVIRPSYGMGDKCLVMWGSGWEEEYCTGKGNCFELVHLEVSPTSGAPVVGEWTPYTMIKKQLGSKLEEFKRPWHLLGPPREFETEGGVAVERGTHWTYGRADPGVGILNTEDGSSTQPRQRGKHVGYGMTLISWRTASYALLLKPPGLGTKCEYVPLRI